jgi:hypothetical protein
MKTTGSFPLVSCLRDKKLLKLCFFSIPEDFVAAKEILSQMKYYDNISEQIREKIMT